MIGDLDPAYDDCSDVNHTDSNPVDLSTGTLYTMIKRLLADGIIVESHRRPAAADDDERRKYYRLTDFGGRVLAAETERLQAMVTAAKSAGAA